MSEWADKLDAYLARTKLTKKKLASELGISIKTLEKWWGTREPSPDNIERINKLLAVEKLAATKVDKAAPAPAAPRAVPIGRLAKEGLAGGQNVGAGERYRQTPVVVSLSRDTCPFCDHEVTPFRNCVYCGQHFAWASLPVQQER